jgi:hypothetical protein
MPGDVAVDVEAAADAATAIVEDGLVLLVKALVMAMSMSMAGCDEEAAVSSNRTCFMCCSCSCWR